MAQQVLFTTQTFNVPDAAEGGPVTVATTVVPAVDGTFDGLQYFGESNPTGVHSGVVWEITADDTGADGSSGPGAGTVLKTVAIPTVLASTWQTVMFDTPLPVVAGKAYRCGYRTSLGHYAAQAGGFNSAGIVNGDLSSPKTGDPVGGFSVIKNGTFVPSITEYPARTFNGNMYPVGPIFTASGDIPPETHTSTGTASLAATASASSSTRRSVAAVAALDLTARAVAATRRSSAGTGTLAATARASVASRRPTTGTAALTVAAGQYTAGGSPGPWLTSRRRQGRIVTRTQVAR